MSKYLVSSATLPISLGYQFTDFNKIPEVLSELDVDGIEFVFLPEWDKENKPLTPSPSNWNEVQKVDVDEIVDFLLSHHLPVETIHVNRDLGNYLSSKNSKLIEKGQRILDESLKSAKLLKAKLVVLHVWDTYKETLHINELLNRVHEVSTHHNIQLTFENIPISDHNLTNEKIWELIKNKLPDAGFTLDLNWCSFYNDFNQLIKYRDDIKNIHVHGYINDLDLLPLNGQLDILSCLNSLKNNKESFKTLELIRPKSMNDFKRAIELIKINS